MRRLTLLCCLLSLPAVAAPKGIVEAGVARPSTLLEPQDLGGTWKLRYGADDAAFKDPAYDDADWVVVDVPRGLGLYEDAQATDPKQRHPYKGKPGLFWYRFRVELPAPALRPTALGVTIGPTDTAVEVFIDGIFVGGKGVIPGDGVAGENAQSEFGTYAVPEGAGADGVVVVALRGWRSDERADSNRGRGGVTHRPLLIGDVRELARREVLLDIDKLAVAILFVCAGLFHLHLWRRRRELTSYLWFGVASLCMAAYMFFGHHLSLYVVPDSVWATKLDFAAVMLGFPAFVQFLWPFLNTPIRWWWRAVQALSIGFAIMTLLWPSAWFVQKFVMVWAFGCALPEMIGILVLVARKAWQGDPEGRTLLIGAVAVLLTTINNIGVNQNWWRAPEITNIAFTIFVLAMAASQANRFARIYGQLDEKNAELVRMDKLKDEFLANTSHELRTPLNGIVGIAEGLIEGAAGDQNAETLDNLRMVLTSGHRLAALINDILDFSKLREGKVSIQLAPLDLHPAADIVSRLLTPLATQKGLSLENRVPHDLPSVLADESRLQQVLTNLVGNAIKFTDSGGVVIEAGTDDGAGGDNVWIAVQDTGPGIAERDHQRIFNAFEQGDGSTERTHGGTGLGLSITRRLVELHGGTIKLASSPGKGSRFTVSLPKVTEAAQEKALMAPRETVKPARHEPTLTTTSTISLAAIPPPKAVAVPLDSRRYRVLLVDDEPINIRVLENHLSKVQFEVARAGDGPAALQILKDGFKPDLVLLDVMMPKMSGYEVCQHIREKYPASEMPVVLVTAKDRVADVVSGFDAGANDYLTKPVAKGELLARIKTHLQVAKMNEATSRFVPFEFLSMLGKQSLLDVERGDQVQKDMSVLFSDIRSFTTIVEKNTPAENFRFINDYLSSMEPPIKDHAGFVDSFIGDAIMALFDGENGGANDAVAAGVAMQRALPGFNQLRAAQGLPEVAIGVGVTTGLVTCGTIGGKFHIKCGVIGDAVNTASRIEGMTKMYGARFLVGEPTKDGLVPGKYTLRTADRVTAKGKKLPTTIYEVLDAEPADVFDRRKAGLPRYEEALGLYQRRAFVDAAKILGELASKDPADKLVALYVERCAVFSASPPGEDWDGVVKLETK